VIGPLTAGTFGTDFGCLLSHTGRVFLASSAEPSLGHAVAPNYSTVVPHFANVIGLRPLRRSVIEAREAVKGEHKAQGGHEGHAEQEGHP
jgi:hypothetical protein